MKGKVTKYVSRNIKQNKIKGKRSKNQFEINKNHEYLYGIQPVSLALKSKRRQFFNLFIKTEHGKEKDRKFKLDNIIGHWNKVSRNKYIEADVDNLRRIVGDCPHQGVVLETSKLDIERIDYLTSNFDDHFYEKKKDYPLWIALDEIQDPQNMGAIIRNSVYYGVDGIITTDIRSSPLNATVSKASSGALEIANIYYPNNLSRFIQQSKLNGWTVIGTSLSEDAINLYENRNIFKLNAPTILVLGSEGKGIRKKVLENCSFNVILPPIGSHGKAVGSLNVSSTLAILLHSLIYNN